ncbi:uncharacterized protein [Panulirus ornatus]|uniref:uncharacterized protein n=1 Tax=Panulirus ornatus TaxID=150431 RepID=UPI003A8435C1
MSDAAGRDRSVDPPAVKYVMDVLQKRQRDIVAKNWVATCVMDHIRGKLDLNSASFLSEAEFYLVGSCAENLATSNKDDRDILLLLGPPYTPQYFKAIHEGHGRYFLQWNKCKWNGDKPRYIHAKNYLSATLLRNHVNSCVCSALQGATISGLKVVKLLPWKQAIRAILRKENDQSQYIVDVLPQIKGDKWKVVDGLVSFGSLEPELQKIISNLEASGNSAFHFALFGPAGTSPLSFTTSFALLERDIILKDNGTRNVMMLAKVIIAGQQWKNRFGIKSAHLKRVAIGNISTLTHLSPWKGMLELFRMVVSQLQAGYLDGFPDLHCDLFWHKNEEECQHLAKVIVNVILTLDPNFLANYL